MPTSCATELQPLDLSFKFVLKSGVATLFASWLSQVAQEQLLKGVPPEKLKFDLTLQNVKILFIKLVYKTFKKISDNKQTAMIDGWKSSGISISWASKDDEIEERNTLYEESRALDRKRELFVVKGGRTKDAAVAGLLEQNFRESLKRKEQEMEMVDVTGTSSGTDDDFDITSNGERWTGIDELDEGAEAQDENELDGEESKI